MISSFQASIQSIYGLYQVGLLAAAPPSNVIWRNSQLLRQFMNEVQEQREEWRGSRELLTFNQLSLNWGALLQGTQNSAQLKITNCNPQRVRLSISNANQQVFDIGSSSLAIDLQSQETVSLPVRCRAHTVGKQSDLLNVHLLGDIPIAIPLDVQVIEMKIDCLRLLENDFQSCVKVALKQGSKLDFRVPFKNNSQIHIPLTVEVIDLDGFKLDRYFSLICTTPTLHAKSRTVFWLNFSVRKNKGCELQFQKESTRKVLVLKNMGGRVCVGVGIEIEIIGKSQ